MSIEAVQPIPLVHTRTWPCVVVWLMIRLLAYSQGVKASAVTNAMVASCINWVMLLILSVWTDRTNYIPLEVLLDVITLVAFGIVALVDIAAWRSKRDARSET